MKQIAILLLSTVSLQLAAFGQGPLTPPGAPAPTFKTLQQVEPRTPITNATAVTISVSGSYYLTTNITVATGDAITITANGVTLDLNGFTIVSTAPSATGTGILLASGIADITILNGHIRGGVTVSGGIYSGSGFGYGIFFSGTPPSNVRVAGVSVSGCLSHGIHLNNGDSTVVESCVVRIVGGFGILASSVMRCTARQCGDAAIYANIASECYGESRISWGLYATTANNCYGYSASSEGLHAELATSCYGYSSGSSYGLYAAEVANTCYGYSASGTGLYGYIAIGCAGSSVNYFYHYNMPPSPVTP